MKSKNYRITLHCLVVMLYLSAMIGCRQESLAILPAFDLQRAGNSSFFNTSDLPPGAISIFIHFDSNCKSCQEETRGLLRYMQQLEDVNIFFLSVEELKQIAIFRDHFELAKYSNVVVARDTALFFPRHFQSGTTPLLALYDRKQKLKAVFEGKADMKKLLSVIEEIREL